MSYESTGGHDHGSGYRRRTRYERDEGRPASVSVASALARHRGEDPAASNRPLYEYVDPDALDALFADRRPGRAQFDGRVRFSVEDLTVVVRSDSVTIIDDG